MNSRLCLKSNPPHSYSSSPHFKNTKVIAFTGGDKVGKTTCANFMFGIIENGKRKERFSFEEKLKIDVSNKYKLPFQIFFKNDEKDIFIPTPIDGRYMSPRELLENEVVIKKNTNYLNYFDIQFEKNFVKNNHQNSFLDFIVIDDLNYNHEYEFLKERFSRERIHVIKVLEENYLYHIFADGEYKDKLWKEAQKISNIPIEYECVYHSKDTFAMNVNMSFLYHRILHS